MNIVQVTPYYPPHLGGMEQRVQDLSNELADHGHTVLVLTSDAGHIPGIKFVNKNLTVKYIKSIILIHTPISLKFLIHLFKVKKNTVIHVHIAFVYLPELVRLVCYVRKIPYVAHVRIDPEPSTKFGRLLPFYQKYFLKPVLRDADKIIVLTADYKDLIISKYGIPASHIEVIPNGTHFKRISRPKTRISKPVRLLFVGRLSPQKNLHLLIAALAELDKAHYEFNAEIIGSSDSGYDKVVMDLIVQSGLQEKIHLLGRVEGAALEIAYQKSDIFLMSSRQESFGSVLIEAMSKGLPVVATDIMAVKNTIKNGRNGILAAAIPTDFAGAIMILINTPDLFFNISKNNLIDVKKYSWRAVSRSVEKVYNDVIQQGKYK